MMGGGVLSPGLAALILFGLFFLFMFLRVPVAFALGLACLPMLVIEPRLSAMTLVQETFNAYNSFILLAVPFFLLTANLMNVGGITDRLVRLSRAMVGHFPGGLAQINDPIVVRFADSLPVHFAPGRAMAQAIAAYVSRRTLFSAARRQEIARTLAEPLSERLGLPADTNPDLLLCALYYRKFGADRSPESTAGTAAAPRMAEVARG